MWVIYTDGLPNKRAVVFIIKELSIDKSLLNITFYIDNDNNEKYSISYSKDLVGIIKEYIISTNNVSTAAVAAQSGLHKLLIVLLINILGIILFIQ